MIDRMPHSPQKRRKRLAPSRWYRKTVETPFSGRSLATQLLNLLAEQIQPGMWSIMLLQDTTQALEAGKKQLTSIRVFPMMPYP